VGGFPRQDCSTQPDIVYAPGLLSSVRNMAEGKLVKTFRWAHGAHEGGGCRGHDLRAGQAARQVS
jgi:hypothetical protein